MVGDDIGFLVNNSGIGTAAGWNQSAATLGSTNYVTNAYTLTAANTML